jgi:hypothetical protein
MSSSLRVISNAKVPPNTVHTKDVKINHELDSIKAIWDTLNDPTPEANYSVASRFQDIEKHLKARAATLQIGAVSGFSSVPGSKLHKDFELLGLSSEDALKSASAAAARHSFRSNTSPSGRARGGKRTGGKKK